MSAPVSQRVLEAAARLAAAGYPITRIAATLNVSRKTLRNAERRQEIDLSMVPKGARFSHAKPLPPVDIDPELLAIPTGECASIAIPTWIRDPILREDWLYHRRLYGRDYACRRAHEEMAELGRGY